jgi:hypothetical protein
MKNEIDNIELSTAKEIYDWLVPEALKVMAHEPDNVIKARARLFLREKKISPYDALEMVRKQRASMPKRIF